MIMNRSAEPGLLRKAGGSTEKLPEGPSCALLAKGNKTGLKKPDNMRLSAMTKKLSGSQTHKDLTTEPTARALKIPPKESRDGLPRQGAGFGIAKQHERSEVRKRAAGGGMAMEADYPQKPQKAAGGNWIQKALGPSSKGKLHQSLGVPMGKKIPQAKIIKAEHSRNPIVKKRAVLAHTLSGMRRGR